MGAPVPVPSACPLSDHPDPRGPAGRWPCPHIRVCSYGRDTQGSWVHKPFLLSETLPTSTSWGSLGQPFGLAAKGTRWSDVLVPYWRAGFWGSSSGPAASSWYMAVPATHTGNNVACGADSLLWPC